MNDQSWEELHEEEWNMWKNGCQLGGEGDGNWETKESKLGEVETENEKTVEATH